MTSEKHLLSSYLSSSFCTWMCPRGLHSAHLFARSTTFLIYPCDRLNNVPPQRCLRPKPQSLWIYYLPRQKEFCRCDEVKYDNILRWEDYAGFFRWGVGSESPKGTYVTMGAEFGWCSWRWEKGAMSQGRQAHPTRRLEPGAERHQTVGRNCRRGMPGSRIPAAESWCPRLGG